MVRSIVQDKEGFMWFATKDGLNKYDGYQMIVYRHNPNDPYSLPDNTVFQIAEDEQGNLWIGTVKRGVFIFDRKKERFYPVSGTEKTNANNDQILKLKPVHGKLMVAKGSDLQVWDISRIHPDNYTGSNLNQVPVLFSYVKQVNAKKLYLEEPYLAPFLMPDGSIWINTTDAVTVFSNEPGQPYRFSKRFSAADFGGDLRFFDVIPDVAEPNKVYLINPWKIIGFNTALNKMTDMLAFDPGKTLMPEESKYFRIILNRLQAISDAGGNIWIKTFSNTLFECNIKTREINYYQYYSENEKLKESFGRYRLCSIDRKGLIWFGSNGFGILKYDPAIENFNRIAMLSINRFWIDKAGSIILPDLSKYDKTGSYRGLYIKRSNQHKVSEKSWFWSYKDKNGFLWCIPISENGISELYCYDESNKLLKSVKDLGIKKSGWIFGFLDNAGNVWLAYKSINHKIHLVCLDKTYLKIVGDFTFPLSETFVNEFPVNDCWVDKDGVFWFGTINGLFSFNPQKASWHHYINEVNDINSMSDDIVFTLCPDPVQPEKYLWLGTNGGGLSRFEYATGKCRRFSETDGLPNMVIYKMLTDKENNIWMSTNNGLSCLNPYTLTFSNFSEKDGLNGNEFNRFSGYKDSLGNLYFGGVNGITWFNPEEVLTKKEPVPLVLTGFSTTGLASAGGTDTAVLSTPIRYHTSVTLPHHKNMVSISFASLDFTGSRAPQYRYYMEGYEKSWKYAGPANVATYTNLDPDQYVFRLAVLNKEGVWETQKNPLHIQILSPWWQTWWFISLSALGIAFMVYFIQRYRINQKLMMYKLRNKIASDLHDEIGSTLSSIVVYSGIIKDKEGNDQLQSIAKTINDSSRATLESMNDIVWSINPKNDSFDSILLRMRSVSNELLEAKNCTLVFETEPGLEAFKLSMIQRRNLYLIFKEALNNVVKYAHATNVHIKIAHKDGNISFRIADDGKGFDLLHIREGNGLLNLKNRATELNGKLDIQTSPGNGTAIEMSFPVQKRQG